MSILDLRSKNDNDVSERLIVTTTRFKDAKPIEESVAQDAVDETEFGKFNYKVLAISSMMILNVSISTLGIGFILSAAACDFKMTTEDKSHLSASSMFGMLCGSYFWGCVADAKGRRIALLNAVYLHCCCEFLASFMPFFSGFLFLKFTSGIAMCGQLILSFTFLAEFQPRKYCEFLLSWTELAWILGVLLQTGIAWVIIPLNIDISTKHFTFHSWNLFVLICSVPALLIGTWLLFFPETPKYLAETGQNVKMLNVLAKMYSDNTGKPLQEYFTKLKNSENTALRELLTFVMEKNGQEEIRKKYFKDMLKNIFMQTLTIIKPPYLKRTLIICTSSYLIMASYYMLILWLPELFKRYAEFENLYPNRTATVCVVSLEKQKTNMLGNDEFDCGTPIQNSVYIYSVILALACFPTSISLPIFINRLGYKFFLAFSTIGASLVTMCIFLVASSVQNVIATAFYESLTSVSISVVYCMMVDFYPTQLRSFGTGLAGFFSRLGAVFGNIMTGALIDSYCTWLISIVAIQLLISGILAIFAPPGLSSKNTKKEAGSPTENDQT